MADIAGAEGAGREADEGAEHDEDDVEIVDEQIGAGRRPLHQQRQRGEEREEARPAR